MKVAMTGVSGNMGREALKQVFELKEVDRVRVLLSMKKKNNRLAQKLVSTYQNRIEIVRGSVADLNVCRQLVKGVDYVVHMAAVIPPASDASAKKSFECNAMGTVTLVEAVKELERQPKFIHISTVALYGNRNELHPWGRVGDPLL
ncbi:MAG: NAD-dependent epimerase/dehydratase family protein, partial [Clostridia bacterium]|nr:NAD-dependent epimerase/dehydratase family protein [Clostridia bacterium]